MVFVVAIGLIKVSRWAAWDETWGQPALRLLRNSLNNSTLFQKCVTLAKYRLIKKTFRCKPERFLLLKLF
jgi:hypothetical protein